jgi:hypothetical protein
MYLLGEVAGHDDDVIKQRVAQELEPLIVAHTDQRTGRRGPLALGVGRVGERRDGQPLVLEAIAQPTLYLTHTVQGRARRRARGGGGQAQRGRTPGGKTGARA